MTFNPRIPSSPYVSIGGPGPTIATPVQKPQVPAAERLTAALQKIREHRSKVSAEGYGFDHHESYYGDFAAPDSSMHMWDVFRCVAEMLDMPQSRRGKWLSLETEFYDARKGVWSHDGVVISIQELRKAISARIQELGLSEACVWEFMAIPHAGPFWSVPFEERNKRFFKEPHGGQL